MPIQDLHRAIQSATGRASEAGPQISEQEMKKILDAARDQDGRAQGGVLEPGTRYALEGLARAAMRPAARTLFDTFMRDARLDSSRTAQMAESQPITTPERRTELRASKKVWTTTYWPTASFTGDTVGNPAYNLWAQNGCLDKFDQYRVKLGKTPGAREHELRSALGWLAGQPVGHFLPSSEIDERNAEATTGVDLDGDGRITQGVSRDILSHGILGRTDGQTRETLDVGWWGECDNVSTAGILFEEPIHDVERRGIRFTAQDIKGLLTVIAASQAGGFEYRLDRYDREPDEVRLKSGEVLRGRIIGLELPDFRAGRFTWEKDRVVRADFDRPVEIELQSGQRRTLRPPELASISRESQRDSAADFHDTVTRWLGEKRPFAMDHDRGDHVWNDNFDGANLIESNAMPRAVRPNQLNGHQGPWTGGELTFVRAEILKGDQIAKRYAYWLERKGGQVVNSGWLDGSDSPDFLHRPKNATPPFRGPNPRNPSVEPELVKELYLASIGRAPLVA